VRLREETEMTHYMN